jgi:import inner membrane translocase subunit TIM16
MPLDEACKILNVKQPRPPPPGAAAGEGGNFEEVLSRFKKLFDQNDPNKGGSFYLQSKILRARERIEMEYKEAERLSEMYQEPKVYKDR